MKESPFQLFTEVVTIPEMIHLFPEVLGKIMEEIYDPSQEFNHKEQFMSYCSYCN